MPVSPSSEATPPLYMRSPACSAAPLSPHRLRLQRAGCEKRHGIAEMELGIEVRLNTEVKDISKFGSDPVVIATGATANCLRISPAMRRWSRRASSSTALRGSEVAVIGGGLTGSEIAYESLLFRAEVSIVEMKNDLVAQTGVCLANELALREWFAWKGVPVYLESKLKSVGDWLHHLHR